MLGQWEVPERLRVRIRALDYDAATAHGNTWEVPKGLHVRMRARRIWTQLVHTTTMEGAQKAACAHVRARSGRAGATGNPRNRMPSRTV